MEPPEEVCVVNNRQKRGTTFPVMIQGPATCVEHNVLLDTGATRSCMNYKTAHLLGKGTIKPFNSMQVVGADGSDLGAVGELQCNIEIETLRQTFIIYKHLRRNVILGTDFTKKNYAGVS